MIDKTIFFAPTEDINPSKLIIALIFGAVASILLAYLYNLFSTSIPIIYFNVLITIGFGLSIGLAARLINRLTKMTDRKSKMILVVGMAISAFVFQWVAFLGTLSLSYTPSFGDYISDIPIRLFEGENWNILSEIYTYGSWSIGGIIFNKFLLLAVWVVEMAIILILPVKSVVKAVIYPFSESANKWYPKYTLSDQFESMSSKRYFLDEHKNDLLKAIQNLKTGEGWRHGKVHIYCLDEDKDAYMSFEKVFIEGRGKGKKTTSLLLENLWLPRQVAKSVLNNFHHEKDRFEIF